MVQVSTSLEISFTQAPIFVTDMTPSYVFTTSHTDIQVGTPESFRAARADLLNEEKSATRLLSSLAEKRRALPAVKVNNPSQYTFTASDGSSKTLLDLFEGRRQLILYHFMLFDKDKEGCVGCSFCMDNLPQELRHLQNRDTTMAAAAPAGIEKVNAFKERMEWKFP